jgi:hypothetical protein
MEQGRASGSGEAGKDLSRDLPRGHDEALWLYVHAQDELWAKRRDNPWVPYNITGSKALVYYFTSGLPADSRGTSWT